MRTFNRLLILAGLVSAAVLSLGATPTEAQQIRNGGPTGTIESHSVDVPGNLGSAQVRITPDKGFYTLTQFCGVWLSF